MRLVLDTNVVASALLWGGPPRHLLRSCGLNSNLIYSSTALLAELTDILSRSKFEKRIAASLLSVDQLVDLYAGLVVLVRPAEIPRIAPDPDDDFVIGTALAAKADFIVTGDRALLSVIEHQSVRLISVREALEVCGRA
jgi:putative PIN family toxin of toxin-antitoxin system